MGIWNKNLASAENNWFFYKKEFSILTEVEMFLFFMTFNETIENVKSEAHCSWKSCSNRKKNLHLKL